MTKSYGFYIGRFAVIYLVAMIVIYGLAALMYAILPDLTRGLLDRGGSTGINVALLLVPALLMGQSFWSHEQRRETRQEGWLLSLGCAFVALILGAMALYFTAYNTPSLMDQISAVWVAAKEFLIGGFIFVFLVYVLGIRLMIWSGLRAETKKAERRAP